MPVHIQCAGILTDGNGNIVEPEFTFILTPKGLIDKTDEQFLSLMLWTDMDLFRQPLGFLFPADAHGRFEKLLDMDVALFEKLLFPKVPIRRKSGGYINFDMKITALDDGGKKLTFYKPGATHTAQDASDGAPAPTDMYSFFNFVEKLIQSPFDGKLEVTMIDVAGLRDKDPASLSPMDKDAIREKVEESLAGKALGGQIGQLDDASYGLITEGDFDEDAFAAEMQTVAEKLNIDPSLMGARSSNIKIDDRDIDSDKLQQALNHTRGVFLGEIDGDEDMESLSAVLDGIKHNRRLIEDALRSYNYLMSGRLVLDNKASISIAVLQQGKINLEGQIRSPEEIIVLPDHPDLALEHDIKQLDEFIRMRVRRDPEKREKVDYYNLCRSTLMQQEFQTKLAALLEQYGEEARLLGFRVTGLPPVKKGGPHWDALKELAGKGHPIWTDRFGDAVVDPRTMGSFKGGFIEMPTTMMKKLSTHFDGKELMSKLVETWKTMDINVVSADLPTHAMKVLSHDLGINVSVSEDIIQGA